MSKREKNDAIMPTTAPPAGFTLHQSKSNDMWFYYNAETKQRAWVSDYDPVTRKFVKLQQDDSIVRQVCCCFGSLFIIYFLQTTSVSEPIARKHKHVGGAFCFVIFIHYFLQNPIIHRRQRG
jgi:hypothetical protein